MNIYKHWKANLENAYSFMLKYSKIIVWSSILPKLQLCQLMMNHIHFFSKDPFQSQQNQTASEMRSVKN